MCRKSFARELDWVCYGTLRWIDVSTITHNCNHIAASSYLPPQ